MGKRSLSFRETSRKVFAIKGGVKAQILEASATHFCLIAFSIHFLRFEVHLSFFVRVRRKDTILVEQYDRGNELSWENTDFPFTRNENGVGFANPSMVLRDVLEVAFRVSPKTST